MRVAEAKDAELTKRQEELDARTPNPDEYDIALVEQVGAHLVLKVKYPSCTKCDYDAHKVMVFLNATTFDALRWKRIDPHFREVMPASHREAPAPAARFPGSAEGWEDACDYARHKDRTK